MKTPEFQPLEMNLITTRICMTKDIGIHGNLFGGNMLSWLDEAGAALAAQACDTPSVVTMKLEEVVFERPVRVGQLIKIYGCVDYIGITSIRLLIEARKHNVRTGIQKIVCTTHITFVCVDDEGDPLPLSERVKERFCTLVPETA
jgi:acyl-CoA thioesterase YciA